MAIKQSQLQQIPQRNKDLAFGYIRECEEKNKRKLSIPEMIKYLCLVYGNPNKDEFDINNTHTDIIIEGHSIKKCRLGVVARTSMLTNIVIKGIHIWTFKCVSTEARFDMIGIRRIDSNLENKQLNKWLDDGGECVSVGYGIHSNGQLSNPLNPCSFGTRHGLGWAEGDIIEMRLDFDNLSLSYKVNENDSGWAFDIEPGKYTAGVTLYRDDSCYCLISYQHIY